MFENEVCNYNLFLKTYTKVILLTPDEFVMFLV
jgi:hypothetical protein